MQGTTSTKSTWGCLDLTLAGYAILGLIIALSNGLDPDPDNQGTWSTIFGVSCFASVPVVALVLGVRRGWLFKKPVPPPPEPPPFNRDEAINAITTGQSYQINVPKDTKWDAAVAMAFTGTVLETIPYVELSVIATKTVISWLLWDSSATARQEELQKIVDGFYPGAKVNKFNHPPTDFPFYRQYIILGQAGEFFCPLQKAESLKSFDPLTVIVRLLTDLKDNERIIFSLDIKNRLNSFSEEELDWFMTETALEAGEEPRLPPVHVGKGFAEELGASIAHGISEQRRLARKRVPRFAAADEKLFRTKLKSPLFLSFIHIRMDSPDSERLERLNTLAASLKELAWPPYTSLVEGYRSAVTRVEQSEQWWDCQPQLLIYEWIETEQYDKLEELRFVLTPQEMTTVWHLPHLNFTAAPISWVEPAFPEELTGAPGERVYIGTANSAGQSYPVYLSNQERAHHLYIAGKIGMGKSTLLRQLIHQDIQAGRGLAVMDPHGKLVDQILAGSIPDKRIDDVVLLDFGQTEHPVPLNPFHVPPGISKAAAFNSLYGVFRVVYQDVWNQGQMDRVFRNIIHTLLCDDTATPLDIRRILTQDSYRLQMVEALKKRKMRDTVLFWRDEFQTKNSILEPKMIQSILNRTAVFLGNPELERMTCHPNALNFTQLIAEHKIVLVNLSGDAVMTEMNSLGAMLMMGFYMGSYSLGYLPDETEPRFYLYVDEVERFVTSPISDMLSQTRKFGLSLTLANQFLNQLSGETLDSISGTIGTSLLFELGGQDAKAFASRYDPEIDVQTLQNLGAYRVAVKTRFEGRTLPAFVVKTQLPEKLPKVDPEIIRQRSMAEYCPVTAEEVDEWLDKRYYGEVIADEIDTGELGADGLGDFDRE